MFVIARDGFYSYLQIVRIGDEKKFYHNFFFFVFKGMPYIHIRVIKILFRLTDYMLIVESFFNVMTSRCVLDTDNYLSKITFLITVLNSSQTNY